MKFPYGRYNAEIVRPVVPITIRAGDRFVRYEVLIDSGADICLFDWETGQLLGLNMNAGQTASVTSIAGQRTHVQVRSVELHVGSHR